jgi:hypothetical protein
MGENLKRIQQQALALPSAPDKQRQYRFHVGQSSAQKKWECFSADWFRKTFPYENFSVISASALSGMEGGLAENVRLNNEGKPQGSNPRGKSPAEIAQAAATFETSGRKLSFYISHGTSPRMTVATLDKMMEASPTSLAGFITHEDESPARVPGYCAEFLAPLAERCVARGRTITLYEKNVWWFDMPAHSRGGKALFNGRTAPALAVGTDDANSRTAELNLLARVGLRQAGLVGHLVACPITDIHAFHRMLEYEYPKHGHLFFRLMVAHTVLGADSYHLRMDNFYRSDRELTAVAQEAFTPFLHLLGKGAVFTPRPDQMAGLSRVGFAVHQPPEKWMEDGHNGHSPDAWAPDAELDNAVLPHNACFWGNTPTPPHALTAVLLHKKRQFGYLVPPTPYGPFVFVPAHADLKKVAGVDDWWHTDGISIWREGGAKLTGAPAAAALRESFEKAAEKLPFRAVGDDVFFQTVQLAPDRYRLYAIDPGWLDPAARRVTVRIQLPGEFAVRDLLSGESVAVANRSFPLEVPAGALRILEAARKSP